MTHFLSSNNVKVPGGGVPGVLPLLQDGPRGQAGDPGDLDPHTHSRHSALAGAPHYSD